MTRLEEERSRALHMRALRRKTLYRRGLCKQVLHKRRRLHLPNRLLIMNPLMKDGQITKKKNANQPVGREFRSHQQQSSRKAWDDIAKQTDLKFGTDNYLPLVRPSVSV